MNRGAYYRSKDPDRRIVRRGGTADGRSRGSKRRDTTYYVRLTPDMFDTLESLLQAPVNVAAGSAIAGCVSRADLIESAFAVYLRFNALARDLSDRDISARDIDDLVTHVIVAARDRQASPPVLPIIEADRLIGTVTPSSSESNSNS